MNRAQQDRQRDRVRALVAGFTALGAAFRRLGEAARAADKQMGSFAKERADGPAVR